MGAQRAYLAQGQPARARAPHAEQQVQRVAIATRWGGFTSAILTLAGYLTDAALPPSHPGAGRCRPAVPGHGALRRGGSGVGGRRKPRLAQTHLPALIGAQPLGGQAFTWHPPPQLAGGPTWAACAQCAATAEMPATGCWRCGRWCRCVWAGGQAGSERAVNS